MKKSYRMFCTVCMVGAVAFLASSCKKNQEKTTLSIGLPEAFEETLGEPSEGERLYVDFNNGNTYKWNGNDQIMVYNLDATDGTLTTKAIYSTGASAEGSTTASFDGDDLGPKKDHYFFFYPTSAIVNGTSKLNVDNFETFKIEDSQDYTLINGNATVDPKALAAAVEVNSASSGAQLKHIFGVFRLRLKGTTKSVEKIVLKDLHHGLAGTATMKLHEVNMATFQSLMNNYTLVQDGEMGMNPSFVSAWNTYNESLCYSAQATGNQITLNCVTEATPDGVALNNTTVTPFYIAVRPGALIDGFKVDVYFKGGTMKTIENYAHPKTSYRIKAGAITGFTPTVAW